MQEDTIAMAFSIMSARQKQKFKDNFEIDMAYSVPGLGPFRCSVFQQRGTVGLVLRVIPVKILTIRDCSCPRCSSRSRASAAASSSSPGRPAPVSRPRSPR
jgi:twitching motility protein PilT